MVSKPLQKNQTVTPKDPYMPPKKRKDAPEGDEELARRIARREGDVVQSLEEQQRLMVAFERRHKRRRKVRQQPKFVLDRDTVQGLKYFAALVRGLLVGVDTPADAGGRRKRFPWTLNLAIAEKLFRPLAQKGLCEATFTETRGAVEFSCLRAVEAAFGEEAAYYARCWRSLLRSLY
jgi:hypothetical protein